MTDHVLTLHWQLGFEPWALRFLQESGVRWAKKMDPGDQELFAEELPDLNWVIRFNEDEATATREVLLKKQGAYQRLLRLNGELRKRPWLSKPRFYLEHMNEPSNAMLLSSRDKRIALDTFTAEYTRMLWEEFGIRSCGYNLGVGHPEPEHVGEVFKMGLQALHKYNGIWSLHEYGWPTVLSYDKEGDLTGWWTLRHRYTLHEMHKLGWADHIPPLHITEAGIDRLLTGIRGGWRDTTNDPVNYVAQLAHYEAEAMKAAELEAIYIYTASAEGKWWSYRIEEADADVLSRFLRTGEIRR